LSGDNDARFLQASWHAMTLQESIDFILPDIETSNAIISYQCMLIQVLFLF